MPAVTVGETTIPYEIRRSRRARRMRITVRPGGVVVVAPWFVRASKIETLVESKRRWILQKTQAVRERELAATPEEFVDGAKVLFRGRFLTLHVEQTRAARATLKFANAFNARVPSSLDDRQQEKLVRQLVMDWLRQRALTDARAWVESYGKQLGLYPSKVRIGNQKTLWGSCSARGVIALNWRLVSTPKPVFEYVVVHELCHLAERNHGPAFWGLVESLLPDFRERRAWLKKHGVALG